MEHLGVGTRCSGLGNDYVCRHYLRGVPFELVTDSKVVAALIKKEVPKRRENLLVRLFEFEFTVTHRKGELNRNATSSADGQLTKNGKMRRRWRRATPNCSFLLTRGFAHPILQH